MSAWPFACLIVACIFAVLWYFFSLLKGKAAIFISGFNSFSKEKREKYDMDRMVKDQADSFALWTVEHDELARHEQRQGRTRKAGVHSVLPHRRGRHCEPFLL